MFNMRLFKVRAFAAGQAVNLLAAMSRGGLQFMLIIWLQGIWLPLHGYSYADTPLWAGIYMLPLTLGFLVAGPASGAISDRFGARAFATGGLLLTAPTFVGLILLPANFNYVLFAGLLALNGIGMGLMAAPNSAAIMNAVPAAQRGAASGIRATGMNAGMVLSMGGFFTLMAVGLASTPAQRAVERADRRRRDPAAATAASHASPVGCCSPRSSATTRSRRWCRTPGADADRIYLRPLLPEPDLGPVPARADDRLHRGDHHAAHRGRRPPSCAASGSCTPTPRARPARHGGRRTAREGDALAVPAVPGEEVAYDEAVSGR